MVLYKHGVGYFERSGAVPAGETTLPVPAGHLDDALREGTWDEAYLNVVVQPDLAFFGQKDFQQTVVIRRTARDLNMPVDIVVVPTIREADGLALSSRNTYLDEDARRRALSISRGLLAAKTAFDAGERSAAAGVTGIARTVGASLSPMIAGPLYASAALASLPFLLAGGLKIVYDLLVWRTFRKVKIEKSG